MRDRRALRGRAPVNCAIVRRRVRTARRTTVRLQGARSPRRRLWWRRSWRRRCRAGGRSCECAVASVFFIGGVLTVRRRLAARLAAAASRGLRGPRPPGARGGRGRRAAPPPGRRSQRDARRGAARRCVPGGGRRVAEPRCRAHQRRRGAQWQAERAAFAEGFGEPRPSSRTPARERRREGFSRAPSIGGVSSPSPASSPATLRASGVPAAASGFRLAPSRSTVSSTPAFLMPSVRSPGAARTSSGPSRAARSSKSSSTGRGGKKRFPPRATFSRAALTNSVDRFSLRSGGIVAAIVIGDRSRLEPDVQRRLQEAGTYHVVAISGGNIAILAGRPAVGVSIGWLVRPVGDAGRDRAHRHLRALRRWWRVGRPRRGHGRRLLWRASVRSAQSTAQRSHRRRGGSGGGGSAVGRGFRIRTHVRRNPRHPRGGTDRRSPSCAAADSPTVARIAVASAAAEVLLLPVGAAFFSRVTFAGLVLNMLAIPLMGVAQIAGMLVVPAAMVSSSLALAAGFVAHLGASRTGVVGGSRAVDARAHLACRAAVGRDVRAVLHGAGDRVSPAGARDENGSAAVSHAFRARLRMGGIGVWFRGGGLDSLGSGKSRSARGDGRLHVTFLDVGQGDSIFVIFPQGSTLLVDAGGLGFASGFDVGDRVVAPVIRAERTSVGSIGSR